jgi:hypothetical protein
MKRRNGKKRKEKCTHILPILCELCLPPLVSYAHGAAALQSLLHPIARPIRRLMARSSTAESAIIAPTMSSPPA